MINSEVGKVIYTYDQVEKETLHYFGGDDLATSVWMSKYALKNSEGGFLELSPLDMHKRMAKEFAAIENKYIEQQKVMDPLKFANLSEYGKIRKPLNEEGIFNYMNEFKYIIPQGSVMQILGNNEVLGSLSNCIVLPKLHDSYGGICYADEQLTHLMKRRCGVGLDISTLRPETSKVSNAAGSSTGAISFMERFSETTREVAQSGRRGALMISLDIRHPDARDFATIKQDLTKVTGANISIKLTDDFMKAVEADADYWQSFPVDTKVDPPKGDNLYDVLIEKDDAQFKRIRAKDLWETIVTSAHNTAEPGLIFWDAQHDNSTSSMYPEYENISTNP